MIYVGNFIKGLVFWLVFGNLRKLDSLLVSFICCFSLGIFGLLFIYFWIILCSLFWLVFLICELRNKVIELFMLIYLK